MNRLFNFYSGIIKSTIVLVFALATCSSASHSLNQIIVKFEPETPEDIRNEIITLNNCMMADRCSTADLHLLQIPETETPEQMVDIYQNFEEIQYAELNYYVKMMLVPNDTLYPLQWNFYNNTYGGINIEQAWDIQIGDPNVIVAVLDSGVAYEDFGIYRQAPDLAQTNFIPGYDFVNNDSHPNDDEGHGTHVTGTIAQSTNNRTGVAGVAFGCSIMPVKVLDSNGIGTVFDIANGIYFAVLNDANVINMSIGTDSNSFTLRNAVEYAYSTGVTIVCAAGNEFENGNPIIYPAAYDDYCIAVGATRFDQNRAYYSDTGSYIDIVAPGGDLSLDQNSDGNPDGILQQTFDDNPAVFNYWFNQGTSGSTPHVSGAAALLISNGVTHPDSVRKAIEQSAKDLGPKGWDEEYGWGLLNVWAAFNYRTDGDLNDDLFVGIVDFELFSEQWLKKSRPALEMDFNHNGRVDFLDFAIMAQNWKNTQHSMDNL
jgi:serine protease